MSGDGVVLAGEATAADVAEAFAASSPETSRSRTLVWQDPVRDRGRRGDDDRDGVHDARSSPASCRRRRSR